MKKIAVLIGILLFIVFSIEYVNPLGRGEGYTYTSHEIMKWRDNRAGAVSVTFDDGYYSQATTGANLLTARNLKGTFFLTIDSLNWSGGATWENWRHVAEQGHEIGSHTVTHPFLTQLSEAEMRQELSESQETINLNIATQSCLTLAYPYGEQNDFVQAKTSEYYIGGRGVWGLNHYPGGPYDPVNFFCIGSFSFDRYTLEELMARLDEAEQQNAWLCVHIHDIGNSEYEARLSHFLDELLTRNMWVDTFGTIVRYMREKLFSTLTILSESYTEITLSLTHLLNNDIYNVPLTIRSTVPLSWDKVEINQGESTSIIKPVIENNEAVVYYNAIPNAGLIKLTPYSPSPYPLISVSPSSLSSSTTGGSSPSNQTFNVWNSGGGTLSYSISVDKSWLSCSPASGSSAGEQDTITVSYSTSSLSPGGYSATITVSDSGASNTPQTIPVSLTVVGVSQPRISVSPSSLSSSTAGGSSPSNQTFNVWNSGGGTLSYSISVDKSWLSCSPASGSSTGEQDTITVSYSTSSLSPGGYSATITVSDSGASNTPQTIPVSLTVVSAFQAIMELNFEEGSGNTAFDTSGNKNDGTLYGALYTTDRAVGIYALYFDGDNDYVACPANYSLRPDNLSVAVWVKHVKDTSSPNYGGIIQGAYGSGYSNGFRILDYNNKPLAQINFGDSGPVWILGQLFTQGEWTHIVLTYDHKNIKLYENGKLVVEKAETRNINWNTTSSNLFIGKAQWNFKGMIDNVSIFDFALNEQEIQQIYNKGTK